MVSWLQRWERCAHRWPVVFYFFMEQNHFCSDEFLSTLNVLIVTLENCDGNEWNRLMDDLSCFWEKLPSAESYEPVAAARCSEFVATNFWTAFPTRSAQKTMYLVDHRTALIAGASAAIAIGARTEFNLQKAAA